MSQIKIVKGNDAPIQWRVSYQGQPLDLTGKAVTLYVINSRGPFQLKGFEVEGHVVTATYYGADQTRFGEHSLVLRLNEGRPEMSTVAVKEAFELVEWSKDQGGESGEPIKVTPIILEADVAVAQGGSSYDDTELREAIEDLDYRVATHSEEIANLQENKADKSELTELSAEVSGKQDTISDLENIRSGAARGATALQSVPDTYATKQYVDNAIKDIPAPTPSASNEWKCVFDGRMEAGKSSIICTTFADGTPLNAREAIIEVTNDIKAADDITGYVRIQSTLNKNKCSFGIITYESASVGDGKIMVQDVRLETSEHFFTKVYIAKDMKNSIAQNSPVGEEIGHNPQIFEDIVSIELASNLLLTEAAPLVKIYAR